MQVFFVYLLKVIIYSGIGFGYYHLALRNRRFHYYNRFYLLMSVALSLALPFLQLQIWQWKSSNPQVISLASIMVTNTAEKENAGHSLSLSGNDFIGLAYGIIAVCLLLSFLSGLIKIIRMKQQYPSEKIGDVLFINTNLPEAPFSFFKNLFWKNSIDISDETGRQIFRHELTHIEQKHSSDKLFLQVITLIFWLNPFYWLIQKELSLIHEFIADEKAVDDKDAEAFARMLLQSQFGKNAFLPLQSFYYSSIKRRLHMLTSSSKTSHSYVRRILALPILSLSILLFAFKLNNGHKPANASHANAPFVLVVDAGHGGTDDGATGGTDAREKDINLAIAKKVAELAPQYGITVKMTRTEDETLSPDGRISITKKEPADAFVSIHVNATRGVTSEGAFQVFITKNNTSAVYRQSRLLGSSLIQSVKANLPVEDALQQSSKRTIYVLDQNPYPSALIECGYMNNPASLQPLTTDAGVEKVAKDILAGVVAYANNQKETTMTSADTTGKPPVYIADGKELSEADMKKLDNTKIESVNVLKGKEATDKYGKKGENGVVVITMKKSVSSPSAATDSNSEIKPRNAEEFKGIYYIDGKEVTKADVDKTPADNIESINVWKGDEAVKKYGDKGMSGVIEITTKKKKTEKQPTSLASPETMRTESSINSAQNANRKLENRKTTAQSSTPSVNAFAPPIAVTETSNETESGKKANGEESYDKVFSATQLSAAFPGGREAWLSYLGKHLNSGVIKSGPTGSYTVNVQFTVAENGQLEDVKALNNPGYGTAEEAVRVIKNSPAWTPAVQNGYHVASQLKQAVLFFKQ